VPNKAWLAICKPGYKMSVLIFDFLCAIRGKKRRNAVGQIWVVVVLVRGNQMPCAAFPCNALHATTIFASSQ